MAGSAVTGAAIEDYFVEDRTFPPPADFAADALVVGRRDLRRGRGRLAGLLGPPGRRSRHLVRRVAHHPRLGPAVRQVVRRRHPQRVVQLPRPPRRGRPRATGRLPLGGRAGRHPHASPTPTCSARCSGSPTCSRASGVGKGDRVAIYMPMIPELPVAMLACARIGAPHSVRVRRLLGRLAVRPHQRRRVQGARHRRRRVPAGRRPTCSSRSPTWRWPRTPSIEHVVVVDRVTGHADAGDVEVDMTEGRDHWYHDLMDRGGRRRASPSAWTARTCSTCCTRRAPRPSPRASCTRPAATSRRSRSPTSTSSTSSPRPTSTGARPTSAG